MYFNSFLSVDSFSSLLVAMFFQGGGLEILTVEFIKLKHVSVVASRNFIVYCVPFSSLSRVQWHHRIPHNVALESRSSSAKGIDHLF